MVIVIEVIKTMVSGMIDLIASISRYQRAKANTSSN